MSHRKNGAHHRNNKVKAKPELSLIQEVRQKGLFGALKSHTFHLNLRWITALVAIAGGVGFLFGVEFLGHLGLVMAIETVIHHVAIATIEAA